MVTATEKTNILLLGSGGREHALLDKLSQSPRAGKLYVAPGNGGLLQLAEQDGKLTHLLFAWHNTIKDYGLEAEEKETPLLKKASAFF